MFTLTGNSRTCQQQFPFVVIARSDSDAATPLIVRTFQGLAASLSLLAMTI
jgi:hypothetical protein